MPLTVECDVATSTATLTFGGDFFDVFVSVSSLFSLFLHAALFALYASLFMAVVWFVVWLFRAFVS